MMRSIYTLLISLFFFTQAEGQSGGCATASPTKEQIAETIRLSKNFVARNDGTTCIAMKAHIFREDGGSGGISTEDLAIGLSFLNALYLEAGIEFYYCGAPTYINNTDLYNYNETSPDNDTEAMLVAATTESMDAVNIYFVNTLITSTGFDACGYAYFPFNAAFSNRSVMRNDCIATTAYGTITHEFGHYFGLFHTHESTEFGPNDPDAENVPRTGPDSNCDVAGDLLCDTHADPRFDSGHFDLNTCMDTGGEVDENGVPYTPPVENIMGYYPEQCGESFTPQQYTRMQQGLAVRLTHTAYSMNCTPPSVAVPTGLSAALNADENGVVLTWTDVAANELGYLIERSTTSDSEGFVALIRGGVGANATTFTDLNVSSNTDYWYRVKPINGDCNTYSTATMISVGLIFCQTGTLTCDEYISEVEIGTIDNASGCTAGGYHNYTALSTDVEIGTGYGITVTNGVPFYPDDQCGIWVDWNQDGDFDDADETISVTGSPGVGPYTATITPPAGAVAGLTRMRCRITWNEAPESCGTDIYGEIEDYELNVIPLCLSNAFVMNTSNSGAGSLRDIIQETCVDDTLYISSSLNMNAIAVDGGQISITKNTTIIGQGPNNSIISGMMSNRIFHVPAGVELCLEGLTLTDGTAATNGGAVHNEGTLRLANVTIENNEEGGSPKALTNDGVLDVKEGTVVVRE